MFQELVQAARLQLNADGSSIASIRMHPEHLGRLTLHLQVRENQVHAQAVVESEAARKLVENEIDALRSELRRQGIQVESVSVRVRESGEGAGAGQSRGEESASWTQMNSDNSGQDSSQRFAASSEEVAMLDYEQQQAGNAFEQDSLQLTASHQDLSALNLVA